MMGGQHPLGLVLGCGQGRGFGQTAIKTEHMGWREAHGVGQQRAVVVVKQL